MIDPIAIVGSPGQTGSTKTGTPITINKPAGLATGNLMVATYDYATYHDVSVIVVNLDTSGLALLKSSRMIFPQTDVIALSKSAATRAQAANSAESWRQATLRPRNSRR